MAIHGVFRAVDRSVMKTGGRRLNEKSTKKRVSIWNTQRLWASYKVNVFRATNRGSCLSARCGLQTYPSCLGIHDTRQPTADWLMQMKYWIAHNTHPAHVPSINDGSTRRDIFVSKAQLLPFSGRACSPITQPQHQASQKPHAPAWGRFFDCHLKTYHSGTYIFPSLVVRLIPSKNNLNVPPGL